MECVTLTVHYKYDWYTILIGVGVAIGLLEEDMGIYYSTLSLCSK